MKALQRLLLVVARSNDRRELLESRGENPIRSTEWWADSRELFAAADEADREIVEEQERSTLRRLLGL